LVLPDNTLSRPNEIKMHVKDIEVALVQNSNSEIPMLKVPVKEKTKLARSTQTRYPRRESLRSKAMTAMKISLEDISYDEWMEDRTKFRRKSDRDKLNGFRILEQDDLDYRYQTALDEVWT